MATSLRKVENRLIVLEGGNSIMMIFLGRNGMSPHEVKAYPWVIDKVELPPRFFFKGKIMINKVKYNVILIITMS